MQGFLRTRRRAFEALRAQPAAPAAAVFVVAAVLLAYLCSRVADWAVMTDELLYERLAISVADGGVPRVHGEITDVLAVLYPLVIAPVFWFVDLPDAIRVVHGVNGVLYASAAIPTWLLARELALSRFAAVASAVFAVAIPWTVIGAFVMTEAAAYPLALWAVLAVQRAIVVPSIRRDLVAVGVIGLASLARPQLAALGVVLVAAAILHELRLGRWREHVVAFALGAVGVLVLALGGAGLLGSYAPAVEEGALVSRDALRSAIVHVDVTAVAIGVLPLLLGLGWAVAALVRPDTERRTAFAAVVASGVVVLALESGSVVVRFGLGLDVKDRYFFYVAPLLFLATACALEDVRPRVWGVIGATAFFVTTVGLEKFDPVFGVNIDSPASSTHEALTRYGIELGMSPPEMLAIAAGVAGAVLWFALRRVRRSILTPLVLGLVVAFVVAESAYTWDRLLVSSGPSQRTLTQRAPATLAWVDAAEPRGTVAMVPYSVGQDWYPSAGTWWDVEFWNRSVTRAYMIGPYFTYTPEAFPRPRLRVDPRSGGLRTDGELDYIVRTTLDARFGPAGTVRSATTDLELVELEVPERAAWMTIGVDPDGWTRPDRPAVLRVYPPAGRSQVELTVSAPDVDAPRSVTVGPFTVQLGSTESRVMALDVCVPEGGYADVPIRVDGATHVRRIPYAPPFSEDFREVGARLSRIRSTPTGATCAP